VYCPSLFKVVSGLISACCDFLAAASYWFSMETQLLCGNNNQRLTLPCLRTAWPVQLRHVSCVRQSGRRSIQQHASNISMGAFDGGADEQQQTSPVDYAPKDPKQLWKAAIKLPMYSVGIVPVLVSSINDCHVLLLHHGRMLISKALCVRNTLNTQSYQRHGYGMMVPDHRICSLALLPRRLGLQQLTLTTVLCHGCA
jgi:hypothetical protein